LLVIKSLTGFTYRGLAPHKLTPVPGVHKINPPDRYAPADVSVRPQQIIIDFLDQS
jgi:hypothetical protein